MHKLVNIGSDIARIHYSVAFPDYNRIAIKIGELKKDVDAYSKQGDNDSEGRARASIATFNGTISKVNVTIDKIVLIYPYGRRTASGAQPMHNVVDLTGAAFEQVQSAIEALKAEIVPMTFEFYCETYGKDDSLPF